MFKSGIGPGAISLIVTLANDPGLGFPSWHDTTGNLTDSKDYRCPR
jgi:hypothetical protein